MIKIITAVAASTLLLLGAVSSANAQTCPGGYYYASDGQCYPNQGYVAPYATYTPYVPYVGAAVGAAALGAYGYRQGWYGNRGGHNHGYHGGGMGGHGERGTAVHRR